MNLLTKCGKLEDAPKGQEWQIEAACIMIGCAACQFYKGGEEFHQKDIKRGIAMWAARERVAIEKGERKQELDTLVEVARILANKK